MRMHRRMVGHRRVWTIEVGGWRVSVRRATWSVKRWEIIRDSATAYAIFLPALVVTIFAGSR